MARTVKPKIRPFEDYNNMADVVVLTTGRTVETNITGNDKFANPPIDMKTLKADNDTFATLLAQAEDGGKKAVAAKNKQREVVIKDLRLLGRYVETVAEGDPATFNTSGFVALTGTRTPQVPLSPHIRSLNHGSISGQIIVRMKAVPGALCYELRYGAQANGTVGTWTTQLVTGVRAPVTLSDLTAGTTYAFSARAMDKAGYSDWSDSLTFMCT